jgi:hypothetical protein
MKELEKGKTNLIIKQKKRKKKKPGMMILKETEVENLVILSL